MATFIQHQVLALYFGTSLPEDCFQDFFVVIVDGKETTGADDLEVLRQMAKAMGFGSDIPVDPIPVFMGFSKPRRR